MSSISFVLRSILGKMSTDEGTENVRRERKSTFPTKVYFVDLKPLIQFDYLLNHRSKTFESPYLLHFTFR